MSSNTTRIRAGRIHKQSENCPRLNQRSVLKMMAVMQSEGETIPKEFLETGRTGRRNAMPDILHPVGAEVSTADLPDRLQQLITSDPPDPQPNTSTGIKDGSKTTDLKTDVKS